MNLNKDPESWARVQPDAVLSGSDAQQRNVMIMALQDIRTMAAEIDRLRAASRPPTEQHIEAAAKRLVAEYRKIWPGSWPAKPEAVRLARAVLAL